MFRISSVVLGKINKKKILLFTLLLIIIITLGVLPFAVKSYINNNGKELIGRKINLTSFKINYFNGAINTGQLLIYEANDIDTFLFINSIYINPNVISCIRQKYVIEDVKVDGLKCNTVLIDSTFNFNSMLDHFADTTKVEEEIGPVHYVLEKLALTNSFINYQDLNLNSSLSLSKLNVSIPKGIYWDNPNIGILTDFSFVSGGKIDSKFNYNIESGKYDLTLNSSMLNLSVLYPYLDDIMELGKMEGVLSTNLFVNGNTNESSNVDILGSLSLADILVEDTSNVKVVGIQELTINIDSLNPARDVYRLSTIRMNKPYARYEAYPSSDNFSQMFGVQGSTVIAVEEENNSNVFVMIKDYVVEALDGIKASNYFIDTVSINDVSLLYKDHTMLQTFEYLVSETNLNAYHVRSNADSLIVNLDGLLNKKGKLKALGILHPQKPEDVTVQLSIDELVMKDLSPYFHQYVAFPVTKGIFRINCDLTVKDKQLVSSNDLVLESFELGKKQKHPDAINLPLKLGVAMLKDRKGDIPLNIPVEGNLSDPKYKVWKTIGKIVTELLLKAATSPYKLIAGGLETDEKSTKKITIDNLLDSLNSRHYVKLDNLSKVLIEKPELKLLIDPYYNLEQESKKMALMKAKADFLNLGTQEPFSIADIQKINGITKKDTSFIKFIDENTSPADWQLSFEDKVLKRYDSELLKQKVIYYIGERLSEMNLYLLSKNVQPQQLNIGASNGMPQHDNTSTKNVDYELLFDVLDE